MIHLKHNKVLRFKKGITMVQIMVIPLLVCAFFYGYPNQTVRLSYGAGPFQALALIYLLYWTFRQPVSTPSHRKSMGQAVMVLLSLVAWAVLPLALAIRWGLWSTLQHEHWVLEPFRSFTPVLLFVAVGFVLARYHRQFRLGVLGWRSDISAMGRSGRTLEGVFFVYHLFALLLPPWFLSAVLASMLAALLGVPAYFSVLILMGGLGLNGVVHARWFQSGLRSWGRHGMGWGGFWLLQVALLTGMSVMVYLVQHVLQTRLSPELRSALMQPFYLHSLRVFLPEQALWALFWGGWAIASFGLMGELIRWRMGWPLEEARGAVFRLEGLVLCAMALVGPLVQSVLIQTGSPLLIVLIAVLGAVFLMVRQWRFDSSWFLREGGLFVYNGHHSDRKKRHLIKDLSGFQKAVALFSLLWLFGEGPFLILLWGSCAMLNILSVSYIFLAWFVKETRGALA